ncbi:MAG: hypothetical protein U0Q20_08265 [Mycobacterium sp.]|nr:hypothetical protein [Mycobacterium sp.]
MRLTKTAPAMVVLSAAVSLTAFTLAALPVAHADEVDGKGSGDSMIYPDSPDPMESTYPGYWEGGGHAGGTGMEAQNNSPGYTLGGEHAGGTGDESQDDFPGYSQGGESAGAF